MNELHTLLNSNRFLKISLMLVTGVLLVFFSLNLLLKAGYFISKIKNPLPPFQLDFGSYYVAAAILNGDRPRLYDDEVFKSAGQDIFKSSVELPPYIYPPFFAWIIRPIALLPYSQAVVVWMVFNLILSALILFPLCRLAGLPTNMETMGGIFFLVWIFPLTNQSVFNVGQVNIILLILLAYIIDNSTLKSDSKKQYLSDFIVGVSIGLAVGIKLFFAPLIIYFWLYDRHRIVIISAVSFIATIVIGTIGAGLENTSRYFQLFFPRLQELVRNPHWHNFSLGSAVERIFTPAIFERGLFFEKNLLAIKTSVLLINPEFGLWLGRVLTALLLILVGGLFFFDWRNHRNIPIYNHDIRISLLILTIMLCMPLSWSHSFVLILVPLAILLSPLRKLSIQWKTRFSLSLLALALIMVNLNWNYIYYILDWTSVPYWILIFGTLGILIITSILAVELLRENLQLKKESRDKLPAQT